MKYSLYTMQYMAYTRLLINDFKMMILKLGNKIHKRTRDPKSSTSLPFRPPNKIAFPFQLCLIKKVFFPRRNSLVMSLHKIEFGVFFFTHPNRENGGIQRKKKPNNCEANYFQFVLSAYFFRWETA